LPILDDFKEKACFVGYEKSPKENLYVFNEICTFLHKLENSQKDEK
jgi:hypothetical protein